MSDPEREIRDRATARLSAVCDCAPHERGHLRDGNKCQFDILCRPRRPDLINLTFVIEVKSQTVIGDDYLAPWIKQAADYVGAVPDVGWPRVAASFIWLVGTTWKQGEEERAKAMLQLAQQFRVGHAWEAPIRTSLTLTFGPTADIYREKHGGWTSRALALLTAKRTLGGKRKMLP